MTADKDDSVGAVGPASIPLPPRQDGAASRGSKAEQADVPTDVPTDGPTDGPTDRPTDGPTESAPQEKETHP